jgi:Sel1 repeat-containing protein
MIPHASLRGLWLVTMGWLLASTPGLLVAHPPSPVDNPPTSVEAQLRLGVRYYNGDGVRIDLRQAAHWFQLAAEQGDRIAQYELGALYLKGEGGLPRDDRRAIELFTRSAAQGLEGANLVLGVDYELGDGIARSRSQAIAYFLRAGGDGLFAANALAGSDAPARLDGALALGNFLASIRNSPLPSEWSRTRPPQHRAGEPPTLAAILSSKRHDEKSSTK